MFRAKTVLVLGAGASVDLGLPMGPALLQTIRDLVDFQVQHNTLTAGDHMIFDALKLRLLTDIDVTEINRAIGAGRRIARASAQAMSIDNLVDALEDDLVAMVAKAAIVRAIHAAESTSLCANWVSGRPGTLDLSGFDQHWYGSLSKLLFEGRRLSGVDDIFDNLEIINFNYDRCLEAYLPHSISNYYDIPLDRATGLIDRLPIHRPYGSAGDLKRVPFGSVTTHQLLDVASGIRTFTEQVDDEKALRAIKSSLASADRIVFLGFAFHRQNVKLLEVDVQDHADILATAFGISASDQSVIQNEVAKAFSLYDGSMLPGHAIELAPHRCAEFFTGYWRTLTAEPDED